MQLVVAGPSATRAAIVSRCENSCSVTNTDAQLPRRLRRLAAVLRAQPSTQARNLCLIRLGESLPCPPLGALGEQTRVPGCTSVVHVHARRRDDGTLALAGAADSRLARGVAALLLRGLQGEPADALDDIDARLVAEAAGLHNVLVASRLNGMGNMLALARAQVQVQAQVPKASLENDIGRDAGSSLEWRRSAAAWTAAPEEIAVLLSGGVDSSVALNALLEAGHRCRAFYLRIWLEDEQVHAAQGSCPWEEEWAYCSAVCEQAGVPLEAISLQREYSQHVVGYLLSEAAAGRTPNPDIMCNSRIKYGVFYDRVGRHFHRVASGHYAQVSRSSGESGDSVQLLRSADAHKDQTYFLSQLTQVCSQ